MKLLVTNDDSIESPFLHELVRALLAAGHEACVVAPKTEQSWTGASKTRHRSVHATRADRGLGCPTWIVDGTPSDAVNIALAHLLPGHFEPEAVVSGINVGGNGTLGFILASGTVAGAWEGVLHGLPAMAVSQEIPADTYEKLKQHGAEPGPELLATVKHSAAHAARLAPEFFASTRRNSFVLHNVNFPAHCRADTPVRRTVPAHVHVPNIFSPADADGHHRLRWGKIRDVSPTGLLTDVACVERGEISHSVLDYTKLGQA